jgi:hypothetical protein
MPKLTMPNSKTRLYYEYNRVSECPVDSAVALPGQRR